MDKIKGFFPQSIKNIYHLAQAILANVLYGFPSKKIKVIGITGTNGKTTTTQMVAKILEHAGKKIAVASTINFKIAEKEWTNVTKYTTLSPFATQKFIKQAIESGCEYLVLETSSHSLDQYRVWGVQYQVAVITNVTREHLDYHKTMEKYRKAKEKLFEIVTKNNGTIIVNMDMEKPEDFLEYDADKKYLYTTTNQELITLSTSRQINNQDFEIIKAENIELGIQNTKYKIENTKFELHLPGLFNVENALAATCVALGEGIELITVKEALAKIKGVPGRMESVGNDKGLNIIVDYAVTPDSLEKLYDLLGQIKKDSGQIIAVFGSCGERDRGKRPIMGKIVSQNADKIIVTNEDPYNEDPWQIINEVSDGVQNKIEGESFWKILDRREAIRKALSLAKTGDSIVVTGKGAEETMAIGKQRIAWNDQEVIKEELAKL